MTILKDINFGINQYCGPAVLSALTGESTDRCAAVISSVSGKKEIKAVEQAHLIEALKRLRFSVEETNFSGSTLFGTLSRMHNNSGIYIVFIPHHVVAVEVIGTEIFICDNHSKTPLDIRSSARLTQRVEKVLKVVAKDPPKFVRSEIVLNKTNFDNNRFNINQNYIYENREDNITELLGSIKYRNLEELNHIIDSIVDFKRSEER